MKEKSTFMNLLGQLRLYSLIDLVLFSLAIQADRSQMIGIVLLHIGFLLFLEFTHKHSFRVAFPKYLWVAFFIGGSILYKNIAVVGFLMCSLFYVKKNSPAFGWFAPLSRGLQYYFLASGVIGFLNPVSFLAGGLLALRNFFGDLRDTVKDRKEGYKTLPVIFGLKRDFKYLHLLATLGTTFVWVCLSSINIVWIVPLFFIQVVSYSWTPR